MVYAARLTLKMAHNLGLLALSVFDKPDTGDVPTYPMPHA